MKNVEIQFGGLKISAGEATPQEVSDLKKLLEQQMGIKITWTTPTYPYWTNPYWQYPHYTTTCETSSVGSGSATSIQDTTTYTYRSATSNDLNCISSNGLHIQNLHLTN